jgi:prevent-host-death family protein
MQHVGVRELKDRLTHYLLLAKKGERIIVTDRRRPIAVLHALDREEEGAAPEERLAALALRGLVVLPRQGERVSMRMRAVGIKGKPLSEIVIEGRR